MSGLWELGAGPRGEEEGQGTLQRERLRVSFSCIC